jgi:hypothetical protein
MDPSIQTPTASALSCSLPPGLGCPPVLAAASAPFSWRSKSRPKPGGISTTMLSSPDFIRRSSSS